jgi:PDZ domain-containing secreted protein
MRSLLLNLNRRTTLLWIGVGAVVVCAWCSLFSALGGWFVGRDMGRRQASAAVATAMAGQNDLLPPLGVLVTRLDRTGPAARAGIQRGDMIVSIDNLAVQDARDLRDALQNYHPGEMARLGIMRGQDKEQVTVRLDPFPGAPTKPYLGIYFTARGEEPADL